jgi:hypothetical protein
MTDEMLSLAHENKRQCGMSGVEFLKGEIEHIPGIATSSSRLFGCSLDACFTFDRRISLFLPASTASPSNEKPSNPESVRPPPEVPLALEIRALFK